MRISLRILAVFEGIVGALIGFGISILASILRVIGGAAGISTDQSHFFLAIILSLLAFVGALLAIGPGLAAAICLLVAAIGFFFVAGPWAIVPALFLLPAAWLAFVSSRAPEAERVAAPQPQPMRAQPQPQPAIAEAPRRTTSVESWPYGEEPAAPKPEPERHGPTETRTYAETPVGEARTVEMAPHEAPDEAAGAEAPASVSPAQTRAMEAEEQPIAPAPPEPARPEPEPRREAQRRQEPPPDTSLPGAPA
ncbi:MAG TPA: hypothetical protein VFQ25_05240 [Ktedonobacterales bacterium]|nr:hypothetical protein [Ktedonobacterales bacterium]